MATLIKKISELFVMSVLFLCEFQMTELKTKIKIQIRATT